MFTRDSGSFGGLCRLPEVDRTVGELEVFGLGQNCLFAIGSGAGGRGHDETKITSKRNAVSSKFNKKVSNIDVTWTGECRQ